MSLYYADGSVFLDHHRSLKRPRGAIVEKINANYTPIENLKESTEGHSAARRDFVDKSVDKVFNNFKNEFATAVKVVLTDDEIVSISEWDSGHEVAVETTAGASPIIDGVTLGAGDRVLVAQQINSVLNGLYTYKNYIAPLHYFLRVDYLKDSYIPYNLQIPVNEGDVYEKTIFSHMSPGTAPTTLDAMNTTYQVGVTPITFHKLGIADIHRVLGDNTGLASIEAESNIQLISQGAMGISAPLGVTLQNSTPLICNDVTVDPNRSFIASYVGSDTGQNLNLRYGSSVYQQFNANGIEINQDVVFAQDKNLKLKIEDNNSPLFNSRVLLETVKKCQYCLYSYEANSNSGLLIQANASDTVEINNYKNSQNAYKPISINRAVQSYVVMGAPANPTNLTANFISNGASIFSNGSDPLLAVYPASITPYKNIIPNGNNTVDLGSTTNYFRDLYVSDICPDDETGEHFFKNYVSDSFGGYANTTVMTTTFGTLGVNLNKNYTYSLTIYVYSSSNPTFGETTPYGVMEFRISGYLTSNPIDPVTNPNCGVSTNGIVWHDFGGGTGNPTFTYGSPAVSVILQDSGNNPLSQAEQYYQLSMTAQANEYYIGVFKRLY